MCAARSIGMHGLPSSPRPQMEEPEIETTLTAPQIASLLKEVDELMHKQDTEGALRICNEVLRIMPGISSLLYTRAKIHSVRKEWVHAKEDCDSSLRKEKLPEVRKEILGLAAESCMKASLYVEACSYFQQIHALEKTPSLLMIPSRKLLDASLLTSVFPIENHVYEIGIEAVRAFPKESLELFNLFNIANSHAQRVDLRILYAKGCVIAKENLSLARTKLKGALQILAEYPDCFSQEATLQKKALISLCLAQICLQENSIQEAAGHFEEAYQLDQLSPEIFLEYINFLRDTLKDETKMLALCARSLAKNPDDSHVFLVRCRLYFSQEKWAETRRECDSFLEQVRETGQIEVLDLAAKASFKTGDFQASYGYMERAYKFDLSSHLIERFRELSKIHQMLEEGSPFPEQVLTDHLIEATFKCDHHQEALKLCDFLLTQKLSSMNRCRVLTNRVSLGLRVGIAEPSLRQDLMQAFLLLLDPSFPKDRMAVYRGSILCQQACLQAREGKKREALKSFEEAWKLDKAFTTYSNYVQFLYRDVADFQKALAVCDSVKFEKEDEERSILFDRSQIFSASKNWEAAIKWFDRLMYRYDVDLFWIRQSESAIQAYLEKGEYEKAQRCARKACTYKDGSTFIHWMKKFLEVSKPYKVDQHLAEQCKDPRLSVPYISELLQTYANELSAHPSHWVQLLLRRGNLHQQEKHLIEATQDYEKALAIYGEKKAFFKEEDRLQLEKLIQESKV